MVISKEDLVKMNEVQFDIFQNVISVFEKLDLKYFVVHGSLLGTVMNADFMPMDDDIDIAMPRDDYEKFISIGKYYIEMFYFIQTNKTDPNYPLEFAKVRDSRTTYISERTRNIKMNQGIFIDIFPLDDYTKLTYVKEIRKKLLLTRINCYLFFEKTTIFLTIKKIISWLYCPSWKMATIRNEKINSEKKETDYLKITGGKTSDKMIPKEWFGTQIFMPFRNLMVAVPIGYVEYLSRIYGNYKTTTLLESKVHDFENVEINAYILDFDKSYTEYL